MKDKRKLVVYLEKIVRKQCTIRQVALVTGYSERHVWALKKRYMAEGVDCLIHKNQGRPSPRRIPNKTRKRIVELYLKEFDGYNFTFYQEILSDDYGIKISYRALYNILTENGIRSPERHHIKKADKHHRNRARRQNFGDMIQIDGTPFQWFKWAGDNKYYCIVAGVDDATSRIVSMYMTENECLYGYMEMLRNTYVKFGSPNEIYSDRSAIFCVTPKQKDSLTIMEQIQGVHERRTQWQRILDEMHIHQILAWSPQAKGRVERMWKTVQSRLPYYFRKYKIKTMNEANLFMEKFFIDIYNKKFAVEPADDDEFFMRFSDCNIDDILCARFPCKTDSNGQFKFRGLTFAVKNAKYSAKRRIELCVKQTGISAFLDGKYYEVEFRDYLTDGLQESAPAVLRNIIYEALLKDMKQESA